MATITHQGIINTMAAHPDPSQVQRARQARRAAVVLVGTMAIWLLVQLIGAEYGWPVEYTLLVDLAAAAGFIWSMVVTYKIWRARAS